MLSYINSNWSVIINTSKWKQFGKNMYMLKRDIGEDYMTVLMNGRLKIKYTFMVRKKGLSLIEPGLNKNLVLSAVEVNKGPGHYWRIYIMFIIQCVT